MDISSFKKMNGKYKLKYSQSESFYKNSLLFECIQYFRNLMKGKLLDLGCGNKPYSLIYNEVCDSSVGCDVPYSLHRRSNVEVLCAAEDIDRHFEKDSFDCVICTEVLEHTNDDRKVVKNINFVLKAGGNLILSAPFTYVLHEKPHDYRRYTMFGLRDILEKNNFRINSVISMGGTFSSGFFIFYYSFTKIFFFLFKKAGAKNLQDNKFVKVIVGIPEFLFYIFNINSFKKKLSENKLPDTNEMFSSLGYFIAAKKICDL